MIREVTDERVCAEVNGRDEQWVSVLVGYIKIGCRSTRTVVMTYNNTQVKLTGPCQGRKRKTTIVM